MQSYAVAHVQLFQQSEAHLYKFHNHVIVAPGALAPTIITVAHTLAPQHPPSSGHNGWTLKQVVTAQAPSRGDGQQTSTIIGGSQLAVQCIGDTIKPSMEEFAQII